MNPVLACDVAEVRTRMRRICERACSLQDPSRLLVTVVAHASSSRLLTGTISDLLASAHAAGLCVDLIVGLDHGFRDARFLGRLAGGALVHHRERGLLRARARDRHRIVIVRNPPTRAPGKVSVLREIVAGFLIPQLDVGVSLPPLMLCIDAESRLFVEAFGDTVRGRADGLARLIERVRSLDGVDVVGTRVRLAPYRESEHGDRLDPDLDARLEPIYGAINLFHGWFPGFAWLPGGGMLGRLDVLMALLETVCDRHPNSRVEDVHLTVLARAAGLSVGFADAVVSTNRCELLGAAEHVAMAQLARWLHGLRDLERAYGHEAIAAVAGGVRPWQLVGSAPHLLGEAVRRRVLHRIARPSTLARLYTARRQLRSVAERVAQASAPGGGGTSGGSWIPAGES